MIKNINLKFYFLIFLAFSIWRFFLFLTAYLSPFIIPNFGNKFPYADQHLMNSGLPHFIWSFANFDGVHYLIIAKDGYSNQFTQVFFPFFPLIINFIGKIFSINFISAALIVSNASFLLGLIIFFELVTKFFNQKIAFWSILLLLTFPTSFFFGSTYTESLFFLLTVSSFYLLSEKRVILASFLGLLASATRLMGIFLAPSFYLTDIKRKYIPLIIIPLGLLSYMVFLKIRFNNPLYFLTAQEIFGQERSTNSVVLFPQVVFRYIKILLTTKGLVFNIALLELSATFFALVTIFIFRRKIPREWFAFSLFAILIPTLTGTFASMPRYILVVFPLFIALGTIKSDFQKIVLASAFSILLFVLTCLFTQGYWVA